MPRIGEICSSRHLEDVGACEVHSTCLMFNVGGRMAQKLPALNLFESLPVAFHHATHHSEGEEYLTAAFAFSSKIFYASQNAFTTIIALALPSTTWPKEKDHNNQLVSSIAMDCISNFNILHR